MGGRALDRCSLGNDNVTSGWSWFSRAADSLRRVGREMTRVLHTTKALGGPFKPFFGLSGLSGLHPTTLVIRSILAGPHFSLDKEVCA
jgi:hypothetical protein